ncbi:unnamed protein product [Knipowitschia caucasica]
MFGSCISECQDLSLPLDRDKGGRLVYIKESTFHQCQTHEDVHGHAHPTCTPQIQLCSQTQLILNPGPVSGPNVEAPVLQGRDDIRVHPYFCYSPDNGLM